MASGVFELDGRDPGDDDGDDDDEVDDEDDENAEQVLIDTEVGNEDESGDETEFPNEYSPLNEVSSAVHVDEASENRVSLCSRVCPDCFKQNYILDLMNFCFGIQSHLTCLCGRSDAAHYQFRKANTSKMEELISRNIIPEIGNSKQFFDFAKTNFTGWRGKTYWMFKYFSEEDFESSYGNRKLKDMHAKLKNIKLKNLETSKYAKTILNLKHYQSVSVNNPELLVQSSYSTASSTIVKKFTL